jgi:hypothetical protein
MAGAYLSASLLLGAHVRLTVLATPNQHHSKAWRTANFLLQLLHLCCNLLANVLCYLLAINDSCCLCRWSCCVCCYWASKAAALADVLLRPAGPLQLLHVLEGRHEPERSTEVQHGNEVEYMGPSIYMSCTVV